MYQVIAPKTPGSRPSVVGEARRIADARRIASEYDARRDLTYHDVRIEKNERLVEYAGPCR